VSERNWLCAYAITRNRPAELDLDPASRLVGYRDLGVVVAEVEPARFDRLDGLDPVDGTLAELAREHDAVVRAVFRHEPVLPLRFGTVLDGEGSVRRLLEVAYDQARNCLDEVEGHREWGVRVRYTEPAATTRPDSAGLTGTQYLVRRRERLKAVQQTREQVVRTAARLEDVLREHATDSMERPRPHGVLVNTAYLVPIARETAFHAEFEWFARELREAGATVETTGPWPPYSFTDVELGVAAHER